MNTKKAGARKVQIKCLIFSTLLLSTKNLKSMMPALKVIYKEKKKKKFAINKQK